MAETKIKHVGYRRYENSMWARSGKNSTSVTNWKGTEKCINKVNLRLKCFLTITVVNGPPLFQGRFQADITIPFLGYFF